MDRALKFSETISNLTILPKSFDREDYEKCEFVNCTFTDISNLNFINCSLKHPILGSLRVSFCILFQFSFLLFGFQRKKPVLNS